MTACCVEWVGLTCFLPVETEPAANESRFLLKTNTSTHGEEAVWWRDVVEVQEPWVEF